jgi:hypothetical protein
MAEREDATPDEPDRRESAEPPESQQNREREGPGVEDPATHPQPVPHQPDEDEDGERVDREAAETFPASDPPANY